MDSGAGEGGEGRVEDWGGAVGGVGEGGGVKGEGGCVVSFSILSFR